MRKIRSSPICCEDFSTFGYRVKKYVVDCLSTWKSSLPAGPSVCQGRGGAFDHCRCGTCFSHSQFASRQPTNLYNVPWPGPPSAVTCLTHHSGHSGHVPRLFGPFCSKRSKLRFGIRAVSMRTSGRSTVFLPPFKAAVWQASKLINAPLQLPLAFRAARWNLFFSLAIWQPTPF